MKIPDWKNINWKKLLTFENILLTFLAVWVVTDLYFRIFCDT
jgi:hypothetical protein